MEQTTINIVRKPGRTPAPVYREVMTVVVTNKWKSLRLRLNVMVGSEVPPLNNKRELIAGQS